MTKVKTAWKRFTQPIKTYEIVYAIPPEYKTEHIVEKTGIYSYIRSCALGMACSRNCIILDIREKTL